MSMMYAAIAFVARWKGAGLSRFVLLLTGTSKQVLCVVLSVTVGIMPLHTYAQDVTSSSRKLISAVPPLSAAVLSGSGNPDGSGSEISAFIPDMFYGRPKLEIPLLLPQMRDSLRVSLNPRFSVGYRGSMGIGWELPTANISRKNLRGVDYAANDFVLISADGEGELVDLGNDQFRLLVDDRALRITRNDEGSFTSVNRDGTRAWFGETIESTVHDTLNSKTYRWMITRVEDRNGNELKFTYQNATGVPYLTKVSYGGRNGEQPVFTIDYTYTADINAYVTFEPGLEVKNILILDTIAIKTMGALVRTYKFNYTNDIEVGSYTLKSVTESDAAASLNRTTLINYQEAAQFIPFQHWSGGPNSTRPWNGRPNSGPMTHQCLVGDFGGGGSTDLACFIDESPIDYPGRDPRINPNGGKWVVGISRDSSWNKAVWRDGPAPLTKASRYRDRDSLYLRPVGDLCFTGDFEGAGRTGIACYIGFGGKWHVALSTGSGWTTSVWNGGPIPDKYTLPQRGIVAKSIRRSCFAGDFDGSGRTGIACYADGRWTVGLSTGRGWSRSTWPDGPVPQDFLSNSCLAGDFDGNGRTDLACFTGTATRWKVALVSDNGWSMSNWDEGPSPGFPVGARCLAGNLNGDSKTDIACMTSIKGKWHVALSTGSAWVADYWNDGPTPGVPIGEACVPGHFTGMSMGGLACYTGSGGKWQIGISNGHSWWTSIWTNGPNPQSVATDCFIGDFNGFGKTGIACTGGDGKYMLWMGDDKVPTAVDTIVLPTGLSIGHSYKWLDPTTQRYLPAPYPVLKQIVVTPGAPSANLVLNFDFSDGYFNLARNEFRGFAKSVVTYPVSDDGKQKVQAIYFHQGTSPLPGNDDYDAPLALMKGRPYQTTITDDRGAIYSNTTTTYFQMRGASTFVAPRSVVTDLCDAGSCYQTVIRNLTYDNLGNNTTELLTRTLLGKTSSSLLIERTFDDDPNVINILLDETYRDATTGEIFLFTRHQYDEDVSCGGEIYSHTRGRFVLTSISTSVNNSDVVSRIAYDKYGNIVCRRSPENQEFRFVYDDSGTWLQNLANSLGYQTNFRYYGVGGVNLTGGPAGFQKKVCQT